jgi:hypothetical protein
LSAAIRGLDFLLLRALRAKVVRELLAEAIRSLAQAGRMKYAVACQIFGFSSAEEAKSFAARRHLETWTRDAARERLQYLASHFSKAQQLSAADMKCAEMEAARRKIGLPPAAHVLRQQSTAAWFREVLKGS